MLAHSRSFDLPLFNESNNNNNYYYYNNNAFNIPKECKTIEEDSPATLAFKK